MRFLKRSRSPFRMSLVCRGALRSPLILGGSRIATGAMPVNSSLMPYFQPLRLARNRRTEEADTIVGSFGRLLTLTDSREMVHSLTFDCQVMS